MLLGILLAHFIYIAQLAGQDLALTGCGSYNYATS